ncbi:hypothetical protein BDV10DRAFT_189978 [Aspergillus recurvatus]
MVLDWVSCLSWLYLVASVVTDKLKLNPNPTGSGSAVPSVETKVRLAITTQELWRMLSEEFGYAMRAMGPAEWLDPMRAAVHAQGDSHRLWPVLHFLEAGGGYMGQPVGGCQLQGATEAEQGPEKEELLASLRKSISYMRQIGCLQSDGAEVVEKVVFGRSSV